MSSPVYVFGTCQKLSDYSFLSFFLSALYNSIGQCVCFCTSIMLILFLWLYSIIWNKVLWYLQHCFRLIITLVVQGYSCFHINFKIISTNYVKNVSGIFMAIALIALFMPYSFPQHWFFTMWAWEVYPSPSIRFDFTPNYLKVLFVNFFSLIWLDLFLGIFKLLWVRSFPCFLSQQVICVYKSWWLFFALVIFFP